jgi:hypothetical protein
MKWPLSESLFQPFPCPVKWVSISQGLPLLCLRAPDEAENRQALWNRIDSTGQVESLKERSRMEESPSTPPHKCRFLPESPDIMISSDITRWGVWLPDGWMESAPVGFPLPPLIPPGPPSLPTTGREGGRDGGLGAAAKPPPPNPFFSPPPRAAQVHAPARSDKLTSHLQDDKI